VSALGHQCAVLEIQPWRDSVEVSHDLRLALSDY
jgi:hypothetical protein